MLTPSKIYGKFDQATSEQIYREYSVLGRRNGGRQMKSELTRSSDEPQSTTRDVARHAL